MLGRSNAADLLPFLQTPVEAAADGGPGGELDGDAMMDAGGASTSGPQQVFHPGLHDVDEGEELDYDRTAYDCLHKWALDWPCLSFDIVKDSLGDQRSAFPHTAFMVAGTQAAPGEQNYISVMRLCNLTQGDHGKVCMHSAHAQAIRCCADAALAAVCFFVTPVVSAAARHVDHVQKSGKADSDDDSMSDSSDEEPEEPAQLHHRNVAARSPLNRVRCMHQQPGIVATWGENGIVTVLNISKTLTELADEEQPRPKGKNNMLQVRLPCQCCRLAVHR